MRKQVDTPYNPSRGFKSHPGRHKIYGPGSSVVERGNEHEGVYSVAKGAGATYIGANG